MSTWAGRRVLVGVAYHSKTSLVAGVGPVGGMAWVGVGCLAPSRCDPLHLLHHCSPHCSHQLQPVSSLVVVAPGVPGTPGGVPGAAGGGAPGTPGGVPGAAGGGAPGTPGGVPGAAGGGVPGAAGGGVPGVLLGYRVQSHPQQALPHEGHPPVGARPLHSPHLSVQYWLVLEQVGPCWWLVGKPPVTQVSRPFYRRG